MSPGEAPAAFVRRVPDGLELDADAERLAPPMLLTRALDEAWTADVRLDVSRGAARVLLRVDDTHWYGVNADAAGAEAVLAIGPAVAGKGRQRLPRPDDVTVRIAVRPPATEGDQVFMPDPVELALVLEDGGVRTFGAYDGRYLSTEVAGGFTGRVRGVEALRGHVVLRGANYATVATPAEEGPA